MLRWITLALISFTSITYGHNHISRANPSSLVGMIDWADPSSTKTMEDFIHKIEEGHRHYMTLDHEGDRKRVQKHAKEFVLYLYNPEEYSDFGSKNRAEDYEIFRQYQKYEALERLAFESAELIEEDFNYAIQYDKESLFGAAGVKIAELVNQIFSTPYSRIITKYSMSYAESMIKSSADLAVAQQAAYFSLKVKDYSFKEIYYSILKGFNAAEISHQEALEFIKKEEDSSNH